MLTKKPFRCGRAFTLSLLVGVLLACGIRQDEFDCENAAAHLQECCSGFSATMIECTYSPYCTTTYPEIDIADSDCIRNESCEDLIGTGVCGRALQLPPNAAPASPVSSSPLCGPGPFVPAPAEDAGAVADGGFSLACLSALDCAGGEACCVDLSTPSSVCGFAPCPSGFQLCATSAECAVGQACGPVLSGVMACGTPVDGGGVSFGGLPDTGDGGDAADAADAADGQAATDAPDDVGAEWAPDAGEGG
jgi:hypothetical protein